ncbi:MAG: hypothetical protein AAF492_02800 [Verrucomicrobiota bacterium]
MYRFENEEKVYKARQREILDLIVEGSDLEVSRLGGKDWVAGARFAAEGVDALPSDTYDGLNKRETELRQNIIVLNCVWVAIFTFRVGLEVFKVSDYYFFYSDLHPLGTAVVLASMIPFILAAIRLFKGRTWAWGIMMAAYVIVALVSPFKIVEAVDGSVVTMGDILFIVGMGISYFCAAACGLTALIWYRKLIIYV